MRRLWLAACGAMLLAGCATTRLSQEPLAASDQLALLQDLSGFRLDGRAAVQVGDDGFNASLSWRQLAAESQLQLSGPWGTGGLKLVYSPDSLRVTSSRGEDYVGDAAAQVISAQLGFVPPFEALRYWVLGLAAPGEPPAQLLTEPSGRLAEMTQQGWHISYDRWAPLATRAGELTLPKILTATHADLRLRLVVDRWMLQVAD